MWIPSYPYRFKQLRMLSPSIESYLWRVVWYKSQLGKTEQFLKSLPLKLQEVTTFSLYLKISKKVTIFQWTSFGPSVVQSIALLISPQYFFKRALRMQFSSIRCNCCSSSLKLWQVLSFLSLFFFLHLPSGDEYPASAKNNLSEFVCVRIMYD